MSKNKSYTRKDFYISLMLAIFFTIIYIILDSIKKRHAIVAKDGMKIGHLIAVILFIAALSYVSYAGYRYTYNYAEDLWFQWMIEDMDKGLL